MKDGSGDLDFETNEGEEENSTDESTTEGREVREQSVNETAESTTSAGRESVLDAKQEQEPKYPYFVRRNNIGDERDKRLEVHVRKEVAEREAAFRTALADELGVSEVSKTDAREFALLAAFDDPSSVAEQMREEGFDELE